MINLVFHEGDERRNDNSNSRQEETGDLETNAFAATGGENSKSVFEGENIVDDVELAGAEVGVMPVLLEDLLR